MKRAAVLVLVSLVLLAFYINASAPAFAHSGRTDSDGGHWNHSTGEYHWHHGMSAHQHYDKDGDGYPEYCPYRDKEEDKKPASNASPTLSNKVESTDKAEEEKKGTDWGTIVGIGFAVLLFGLPVLAAIVSPIVGWIHEKMKKRKE